MENTIRIDYPADWIDYELIDSGNGAKLERFGGYIVNRPDPRAVWKPKAEKIIWDTAHATYIRGANTDGQWKIVEPPPHDWQVRYGPMVFTLEPTSFKHVGIFPEQAVNWRWMQHIIGGKSLNVLNLFAYTGGATIASALAGANVTHVDSSKGAIEWAKRNSDLSGVKPTSVRWIVDDAYKFAVRESKRGKTYDGLILDPPRFGRGTHGEVWKIEEDLPRLLDVCRNLLTEAPSFILLNAYTADLSGIVLNHLITDLTVSVAGQIEFGELTLKDTTSGRLLPSGIFARWSQP